MDGIELTKYINIQKSMDDKSKEIVEKLKSFQYKCKKYNNDIIDKVIKDCYFSGIL